MSVPENLLRYQDPDAGCGDYNLIPIAYDVFGVYGVNIIERSGNVEGLRNALTTVFGCVCGVALVFIPIYGALSGDV